MPHSSVIVLLGASSASATGLFKDSGQTQAYSKGQNYKAFFDTSAEDVTCVTSGATSGSTIVFQQGEGNTGTGVELMVSVPTFRFQNCDSSSGFSCTVTEVGAPVDGRITFTSGSNGILAALGPEVSIACGVAFLWCEYEMDLKATVIGGNPAKIEFNKLPLTLTLSRGSIPCPVTGLLSAVYTATSPTAIFVGA